MARLGEQDTNAELPFAAGGNGKTNSTTTAPTATDDSGSGYAVGSKWINTTTGKEYTCMDATSTAAVWTETTQAGGSVDLAKFRASVPLAPSDAWLLRAGTANIQTAFGLGVVSNNTYAYYHYNPLTYAFKQNDQFTIFDDTWELQIKLYPEFASGLNNDSSCHVGIGFPTGVGKDPQPTYWFVGIYLVKVAGVWKTYARVADGTSGTDVDISTSYSFASGNPMLRIIYTGGTDVKFYRNNTLATTISTNLPSANSTFGFTSVRTYAADANNCIMSISNYEFQEI